MKKLTVLCLAKDAEPSLDELRRLGVLHLVPVRPAAGAAVEKARAELARARQALQALARAGQGAAHDASEETPGGPALVDRVLAVAEARLRTAEKLEALRAERSEAAPLGDLDPELVKSLGGQSVHVRIYRTGGRSAAALPEGAIGVPLGARGELLAVVARDSVTIDMPEVPLPARRLSAITADIAEQESALAGLAAEMSSLAQARGALDARVAALDAARTFSEARQGMGDAGQVAYLQGFCPVDAVDAVRQAAESHGWGLLVEEPAAGDRVPTLIRNPRWIRPIESLFRMISILPGYNEVDVSASFLFFLSIFFAMIVGDAGYGLVFLLLTRFARHKMKNAPSAPFSLMTLFSVCTIAWGVLSGAYFGIDPLPAPLARLQAKLPITAWLADQPNIMTLCLTIGSIHLSIAHIWGAVRVMNSLRALAQLGWVAVVWTMFFLARTLMFGIPFPVWYLPVGVGGFVAVVLFMTPPSKFKDEWINHAMLPLSVMSAFGDVLSYLRLFALGVAGFKVAGAFNLLAGSVGFNHVLTGLAAALILFVSHALNVALAAMSVLVHGIRLNALEFSMHLGLEWSGTEYIPFRNNGPSNEGEAAT